MKRHLLIGALGLLTIICAIVGLVTPRSVGGAGAWSFVVLVVLYGWGSLGRIALKASLGIGEQLALGAIAWIGITGLALAAGIASRMPLFGLSVIGFALALYDLYERAKTAPPFVRPSAPVLVVVGIFGVFLVLTVLGMVSTRGNPYDDHVAYTAFVKRVLDCGDLVEPYSFRRLSAYGGQTMLLALAALRGDVESIDLLDRGIFHVIALLLLVDIMRRRKIDLVVMAIVMFLLLSLRDLSINCASVWSGFTIFGVAYSFSTRDDLPPRASLFLALAACGAACTLRQNYLAPAGLFALLLVISHFKRTKNRKDCLIAIGVAAAIVLPYMVAALISNHTFLYPILQGTGNASAPLQPAAHTWIAELGFFSDVMLTPEPIRIWWILVPAMLLAKDPRPGKPFTLYLISCAFGFAFLIHSFMLSEAAQLWRYGYGYLTPLVVIFIIEITAQLPMIEVPATLKLPSIAAVIVWIGVISQIVASRDIPTKNLAELTQNIAAAPTLRSDKTYESRRATYRALQAAIPEGASIGILLDDPYLLDFDRNRIFNLDIPGYAAPKPGLPSFQGGDALRAHFIANGVRYLAFIDHSQSTYLYRRAGWFMRMFHDGEIWQFIAAHMVDIEDRFQEFAKTQKVVFQRDGIYAIDLGTDAPPPPPAMRDELTAMYDYIRKASETELGNATWELSSRRDVMFVPDGMGPSNVHAEMGKHPRPTENPFIDTLNQLAAPPSPHRYLIDRTHVRLHGDGELRHLRATIDLDLDRLVTHPTITFTLDGRELGTVLSPDDGRVQFATDTTCNGWCDLYIVVSTMSEWWWSADGIHAIKLRAFGWEKK